MDVFVVRVTSVVVGGFCNTCCSLLVLRGMGSRYRGIMTDYIFPLLSIGLCGEVCAFVVKYAALKVF